MRSRLSLALTFLAVLIAAAVPGAALSVGNITDEHAHEDFDSRVGQLAPSAAQEARVARLGAHVEWSKFGTPASLIRYGDYLATGLGSDAVAAARRFISENRGLFKLSEASVGQLELLNDGRMPGSEGHAVLFRQRYGALPAAQDGLIAVGVVNGNVAYVGSSATGDLAVTGEAKLTPTAAWLQAAENAGLKLSALGISNVRTEHGWTVFSVDGLVQEQRARLVGFPTLRNGVRPAYETHVVNVAGGAATAYHSFVDADTGAVLFRRNAVQNVAQAQAVPFAGSYTDSTLPGGARACGPDHTFNVPAGTTTIDVAASAVVPTNDIMLDLIDPTGKVVGHSDTATSPEAIHYQSASLVPGTYIVRVCPYGNPLVPPLPPFNYAGLFTSSEAPIVTLPPLPILPAPGVALNKNPRWKYFAANPPMTGTGEPPTVTYDSTDSRLLGCWAAAVEGVAAPAGCSLFLQTVAPRDEHPWDVDPTTNQATLNTTGNNATAAQAWASPLTPAENYRPLSPTREYVFPWTNQWNVTKCSPTAFTSAQRADTDAAIVNLFASHNRHHDWQYHLGFTEKNYNMQVNNYGQTDGSRERDPQIGNSQAGAGPGGAPTYLGRDNANQITLNDGVSPISNMYLWQPIQAGFYAPCVDGDYDMSIIGHEYTHATSNRMIGGPDAGIATDQGGAMGESWSDLVAVEYLLEYGYIPNAGENPFAVGPYATGNKQRGIRNYGMNASPLNFSDIGYDITGRQVHADGEIWSATNYDIRRALVAKHGGGSPETQRQCADGQLPAAQCPGNRRWMQIVFDAWLLMPADVSMLGARDAYLAADKMRFGGANQAELWGAFAKRGFGVDAATNGGKDEQPTPNFETPEDNEAVLAFELVAADRGSAPVQGSIYVGDYEARVTPIADTRHSTELGDTAAFTPGTYEFVANAPGYGHQKFKLELRAGETRTITVHLPTNHASAESGGKAAGDGGNHAALIDDTEATNWASLGKAVDGMQVTVDLGGGMHTISKVHVSAMLRAAQANNGYDPGSQNRFSALRQFEVWTSTNGTSFSKAYTSPANAFPAVAPRPVAPDLIIRGFDIPNTRASHVRLVVKTNQCTGNEQFHGEQDTDPANPTDCKTSAQARNVRAAEFQVFGTTPARVTSTAGLNTGASSSGGAGQSIPSSVLRGIAGTKFTAISGARVKGWGSMRVRATKRNWNGWFRVDVRGNKKGRVLYVDRGAKLTLRSTKITYVGFNAAKKSARIKGTFVRKGKRIAFTIIVVDYKQVGRKSGHAGRARKGVRGDVFHVTLRGYKQSRQLNRGNLQVAVK